MVVEQLNDSINNAKNILLVSHINPDGDTLGSMCGMYSIIKDNYKKKCDMVTVSKVPSNYEFLPYIKEAKFIENVDKSREYDLVINLDVADINRCSDAKILFDKAKGRVNIDHHETNDGYADINIIDAQASATAEVVFDIAQKLGWRISPEAAENLYIGIMTDTGSFRYSNTTPKTLEICAKLLASGLKPDELYKKCYESNSKELVLFQTYCINKAKFSDDDKIAYTLVYKKDLEKYNNGKGEDFTEGLTEKLRAIKSTEVAFVLKELNSNMTKVSMRSKNINIAKICANFGGGGHKLAAGAVIKENIEEVADLLINQIRQSL